MSTKIRLLVFLALLFFNTGGVAATQVSTLPLDQNGYASSKPGIEIADPASLSSDLQFTASGHAMKFSSSGIYLASADHAVRIEFVGANQVNPVAGQSDTNRAAREYGLLEPPSPSLAKPLGKVTYAHLWEGVTLVYQRSDQGLVKSTYRIEPPILEHLQEIHLRYNTGIELLPDGSLSLKYETGQMVETAPVAWQEAKGVRAPVQAAFRQIGEQETGFTLRGEFDPSLPLVIDPMLMWASFLGASGHDMGYEVAVDGSGNAYVVGLGTNPYAGDHDAFVAKLDSSGTLAWITFLGSTDIDEGFAVALDGAGNIYLAGRSLAAWGGINTVNPFSGGIYSDAFAAKLDSSGALVWNSFMGSNESGDRAIAIAVDDEGNVYVGGYSGATWGSSPVNPFSGDYDGFCAKLNNNGIRQWHTFLGSSDFDLVTGIALYESEEEFAIYLSGASAEWGTPGSYVGDGDAFIAKLNASGTRQWNLFLGSASSDGGNDVAVDSSGNIYITGISEDTWGSPVNPHSGYWDGFAAKISSSGSLQWNTFMEASEGEGIEIDGSSGDVFVAGSANWSWGSPVNPFGGNVDGLVIRLNSSSGAEQWHTFMGGSSWDYSRGIAVRSGNVYVAGYSGATWGPPVNPFTTKPDAFAARLYASDGVRQWNTFIGSKGEDYGRAIAVDASGNIYIAGHSIVPWGAPVNAHAGGWEAFVAKLNDEGIVQWSTFLGSATNDYAYGIAVYGSDVYVVGSSDGVWGVGTYLGGVSDAFVAKLNANSGVRQWNVFLGTDGDDQGYAITADASGVFVTGYRTVSGAGSEILVARLNSSGGTTWSASYGAATVDVGYAIVTNASETVYVAGMSDAPWKDDPVNDYTGGLDAVVAALAISDGSLQWYTYLGSSSADFAAGIDVDGSGNIYLAGASGDTWGAPVNDFTDGLDAYAASLDDEGNLRWNTFIGSSDTDQGFAISVGNLGDVVYVTGYSDATWGSPIFPYYGDDDAFVARFDGSDGEREWNLFLGSEDDDVARGIALDASGWIYLAGSSEQSWDIDWTIEKDYYEGSWDAFVARLAPFDVALPIVKR